MPTEKIWDSFTNKYALSKTLRFELRPIGKTRQNMDKNLQFDEKLQTFFVDQTIKNAYQALKPVFDKIHEEFITGAIESEAAKNISFSQYFDLLQKQRNEQDKDKKKSFDKPLEAEEKHLRKQFEKAYDEEGKVFKDKVGKNTKGKDILKEGGFKVLTETGILEYIAKNANEFSGVKTRDDKELSQGDILAALENFKGFFTYFGGFNQNRENYYATSDEKSTAVATRIVNENLPKFCDNILAFASRKDEYLNIYGYLKNKNITLRDKENNDLYPISEDLFEISYFNKCLSQKEIEKYNKTIGNANFLINIYNQRRDSENGAKKLSLFKTLYKQVGCGKKDEFISLVKTDDELKDIFTLAKSAGEKYFSKQKNDDEIKTIADFIEFVKNHLDYRGVYWSKTAINTISGKYFANWYSLSDKLKFAKTQKGERQINIPEAVELFDFFETLDSAEDDWKKEDVLFKESIFKGDNQDRNKTIIEKADRPSQALIGLIFADLEKMSENFLNNSDDILQLTEYKNKETKEKIKLWLDNAINATRILKYFVVKDNKIKGNPIDATLSQGLGTLLNVDNADWFGWYDATRNYLTKNNKIAEENKLKLNFQNSTLAGGWDENKIADNFCVILKDEKDRQYLVILTNESKKFFEKKKDNLIYSQKDDADWQKMEYKLIAGASKALPKAFFSEKWTSKNSTPADIETIYKNGAFKKGEEFRKIDLHKLIDFYKDELEKYPSHEENYSKIFKFAFTDTSKYESIDQFYIEVDRQGYKLEFVNINKTVLDKAVEDGKIYLFEIRNQDYNDGKKDGHKQNLHTIYWNAVFGNSENKPKLNGEAEIFYRPALAAEDLEKNKDKKGKEIIKNFRFSREKFVFHCPITLNFCLKENKINSLVNEKLTEDNEVCFLGIDRGEKHLAYYSLIDRNGNIIKQNSFNVIDDQNYEEKLAQKAGNRDEARKNWQTIGTIKELKDGYISQVVRKIVDMAVENNAVIVLENLNVGFKRGRQKIEKQVYQKLELALAKKLNFLVDKDAKIGEVGSVTNALQLTPLVNNFKDIEKANQFGIMLYVRANYTSQTDPKTGWRKTIYFSKTKQEDLKKEICDAFDDFGFDGMDYYFTYSDKNTGKKWMLYSGKNGKSLGRFRGKKDSHGEWKIERQNIVEILDDVFEGFDKTQSLKTQIEDGDGVKISKIPALKYAIELIQQIRNTGTDKKDDDFILSPVRDKNGDHFDSRSYSETENADMPTGGDANGAYNIARKGLMLLDRIKENPQKPNLLIRDEEWDKFAQKQVIKESFLVKSSR